MTTKTFEHPLESTFNMSPGSMQLFDDGSDDMVAVPSQEVAQTYQDDAEDIEINEKIETIYEAAMDAYHNQAGMAEIVEPRYAARNAEVAANYLNIALNSVSLKAKNKIDKRKQQQFIPFNNTTNISGNNVVVASRNEILRMMAEKNKEENQ